MLEKKPTMESKNERLAMVVLVVSEEMGWWRGCVVFVHSGSKVVVAGEMAGKEEGRERELSIEKKNKEREASFFYQLCTQISSSSRHEIYLYL